MLMVNPNRPDPEGESQHAPASTWHPLPFFAWALVVSALGLDIWVSVFLDTPFRPWAAGGALLLLALWSAVAIWKKRR